MCTWSILRWTGRDYTSRDHDGMGISCVDQKVYQGSWYFTGVSWLIVTLVDDARWREHQKEIGSYSDRYTSLGLQYECPVGV